MVICVVDAVFNNGLTRITDLSKEAILQAIKDQDLRFLQVDLEIMTKTRRSVKAVGFALVLTRRLLKLNIGLF